MAIVGLQNEPLMKTGQVLERIPLEGVNATAQDESADIEWDGAIPRTVLQLPPESVTLWRVK